MNCNATERKKPNRGTHGQRGKLSLNDEVKKFVSEWSYTEEPITIRHLLTHTSGLRTRSHCSGWLLRAETA